MASAPELLDRGIAALGREKLLNKAGAAFRKLPGVDKGGQDAAKAMTGSSVLAREPLDIRAGAAGARRLRG